MEGREAKMKKYGVPLQLLESFQLLNLSRKQSKHKRKENNPKMNNISGIENQNVTKSKCALLSFTFENGVQIKNNVKISTETSTESVLILIKENGGPRWSQVFSFLTPAFISGYLDESSAILKFGRHDDSVCLVFQSPDQRNIFLDKAFYPEFIKKNFVREPEPDVEVKTEVEQPEAMALNTEKNDGGQEPGILCGGGEAMAIKTDSDADSDSPEQPEAMALNTEKNDEGQEPGILYGGGEAMAIKPDSDADSETSGSGSGRSSYPLSSEGDSHTGRPSSSSSDSDSTAQFFSPSIPTRAPSADSALSGVEEYDITAVHPDKLQ